MVVRLLREGAAIQHFLEEGRAWTLRQVQSQICSSCWETQEKLCYGVTEMASVSRLFVLPSKPESKDVSKYPLTI